MAAPKIRADYEQLQAAASRFGQQAQTTRQTLRNLQQQLNVLQAGDWVGQGANAFYQEMNESVLPTFRRLITALEGAADGTSQISAEMQSAEERAASVLKGAGAGPGAPANAAASDSAAGNGTPGASAPTDGAVSSGTLLGEGPFSGAAASLDAAGPSVSPPDTSHSRGYTFEAGVSSVGLVASTISILEAGGTVGAAASSGVIASAGVGTTVGALLLPIGAAILGTAIGEEHERQQQLIHTFKTQLTGGALVDATQQAVAQLADRGTTVRELNPQGQAAVKALGAKWKSQMNDDIDRQLLLDGVAYHAHIESIWQDHYDDWVQGMSKDLRAIYADPNMTR